MKRIGILGGLGPESTADYYREIITPFNTKYSALAYPEIIVYSANINEFIDFVAVKDWFGLCGWLLDKINSLHRAGAEFVAIASNTPHIVFDEIQGKSPTPLLSIVEATCTRTLEMGLKSVGLMGTQLTMEADFYKSRS